MKAKRSMIYLQDSLMMELLKKTENLSDDPRQGNADKKVMCAEGWRSQIAAEVVAAFDQLLVL